LFFTEQQPMATNDKLHFYFLGGSTFVEPTPLQTTSFTVNISDQYSNLPVLSYGTSKNLYTDGTATYSCLLQNQCALVKFDLGAVDTDAPIALTGMKTEATINFANNTVTSGATTGNIVTYGTGTARYAIVLSDQSAVEEGTISSEAYIGTFSIPAASANAFLTNTSMTLTDPLSVPLTLEVLEYGNITVNIDGTLSTGMKYSVNGGEKQLIYTTTTIEYLDFGDKVQFYGNGTSTQVYGGDTEVKLLGSAWTKVYGNIMSLIDENNYAACTTLPNQNYVFYGLFEGNSNLFDASGLLLPATTLAESCYRRMFKDCTRLTAAPALPATTLATSCYSQMFYSCMSLRSITCLATSGINSSSTGQWMYRAGKNVTGTKTFTKASGVSWPTGDNGIPTGWDVNEQ